MDEKILKKLHNSEQKILDEIVRICNIYNLNYFLIGGTLLGAVRHKGYIPWDDDLDIAMPREDYNQFIKIAMKELNEEFMIDCQYTNKNYWLPFIKIRLKNTIMDEKKLANYRGCKGIFVDVFPLDYAKCENSKSLKLRKKVEDYIKELLMKKNLTKIQDANKAYQKLIVLFAKLLPNKFMHTILNLAMQSTKKDDAKYFVNLGSQYKIERQTHLMKKYFPAKELEFEGKKYKVPNDYEYVLKKIYGEDYMCLPPIEKRITHMPSRIKFEDDIEIKFDRV